MTQKNLKRLAICIFCTILTFSMGSPFLSYATTQDDYDANNAELESLRAEQDAINGDIADINTQINNAANQISNINTQISEKQNDMDALQAEIDALNIKIEDQYKTMKLRIQYMYEHNDEDTIELLLSSKSLGELLVRTEYVSKISDYDRNMLEQLNNLMVAQNANKAQLESDMSELVALKADAEAQSANLNTLLSSAQSQYNANADDIAKSEELALQYEAKLEEERIAREQAAIEALKNQSSGTSNGIGSTSGENNYAGISTEHNATDLAMLAAIIECEAGNQSYEGKLAVASVVINRVKDSRFDNTISGVIYVPYQFSPVSSGRFAIVLARGATSECVRAAQDALDGNLNITALYFHVYNSAVDSGGTVIGNHVFY